MSNELLTPRIKVIALAPLMKNEVGSLLRIMIDGEDYSFGIKAFTSQHFYSIDEFKQWPYIFKILDWWEDREWAEMPKYLKYKISGFPVDWVVYPANFSKEGNGWTCHIEKSIIPHGNYLNDKLPATEAEYLSYQQYLEGKHK